MAVPRASPPSPGPLPNDYSFPGTPWEFVSIGVNGFLRDVGSSWC